MSRRKEPAIPQEVLDQLLTGTDAAAALSQGGLLDTLKKALAERALNAEMDHHLEQDGQGNNSRNGYGRKTVTTETGRIEIEVPRDRAASSRIFCGKATPAAGKTDPLGLSRGFGW